MALVKRRKYADFVTTNASTITAPSVSPFLLATQASAHDNNDTLLRYRVQFSMSVQVGSSDAPPEIWWPVTQILLIAWWSDSGSTAIGPSFGSSEHFLGSRLLSPVCSPSISLPTQEYVITYTMRDDLVTQTSRKGSGVNTPHVGVGMTVYDPYNALDGTYASIGINWQGHVWSLWGSLT
jgi:hypothetical protein